MLVAVYRSSWGFDKRDEEFDKQILTMDVERVKELNYYLQEASNGNYKYGCPTTGVEPDDSEIDTSCCQTEYTEGHIPLK